jgi:hypothetical protein
MIVLDGLSFFVGMDVGLIIGVGIVFVVWRKIALYYRDKDRENKP